MPTGDNGPDEEPPFDVSAWRTAMEVAGQPSYHSRLLAYARTIPRQTGGLRSREPVWDVVDKLEGYRFAAASGVPTPTVYGVWEHVVDVPFDDLPDAFVLKPTRGYYSHGVWALRREAQDQFRNVLNQRIVTRQQILDRMRRLRDRELLRWDPVFAEELVDDGYGRDRPPSDWKVYCFYGEVGMVMARDTRGSLSRDKMRFRYWDADWSDLGQANLDNVVDAALPPPRHPDALLAAARTLSAAVPRPHIRVDFYDTARSVYFGEFTLVPGGGHVLSPAVDRRLGAMWEAAEARLLHDFTVAGYLELGSPEDRRDQRLLGHAGARAPSDGDQPPRAATPSVAPAAGRETTLRRLKASWRRTTRP